MTLVVFLLLLPALFGMFLLSVGGEWAESRAQQWSRPCRQILITWPITSALLLSYVPLIAIGAAVMIASDRIGWTGGLVWGGMVSHENSKHLRSMLVELWDAT